MIHYEKKAKAVTNSTNINKNQKTKNEQSPLILTELTQHKKDHEI